MASDMKSETGEVIREFKASEKPISSSAFLCGEESSSCMLHCRPVFFFFGSYILSFSIYMPEEKIFALASSEVRILSLENGEEVLKFSDDVVSYLS